MGSGSCFRSAPIVSSRLTALRSAIHTLGRSSTGSATGRWSILSSGLWRAWAWFWTHLPCGTSCTFAGCFSGVAAYGSLVRSLPATSDRRSNRKIVQGLSFRVTVQVDLPRFHFSGKSVYQDLGPIPGRPSSRKSLPNTARLSGTYPHHAQLDHFRIADTSSRIVGVQGIFTTVPTPV